MKLVLVEFYDSKFIAIGGWYCKEHIKSEKLSNAWGVGVILEETDREIKLLPLSCEGDWAQGICIPKVVVKRIRQLKIK